MLGRGRARREYRVYAEDRFLDGEDLELEDARLNEVSPGGWPEDASVDDRSAPTYTAPPRRLSSAVVRRSTGVALLAALAMVLSAMLVHALRPVLAGGSAGRTTTVVPAPAVGASATLEVRGRAGAPAVARAGAATVARADAKTAGAVAPTVPPHAGRATRSGAVAKTSASTPTSSTGSPVGEEATAPASSDVVAPDSAPASPEFGFER
jgi:hypothetical protein